MNALTRFGPTLMLTLFVAAPLSADDEPKEKRKISSTEQRLIDLVNKSRKEKELEPLKPNVLLFEAARAHSQNMARQQKMEHVLDETTPGERVKKAGYRYRFTGENIAAGGPRWTLEGVHKGWMDSEGHRKNILSPKYGEIGIGIARGENGYYYYTQLFGRQLKK